MFRKLREAQNEEGFTLIELLVVVLIIGILAAIAIPVFLNQREKAFRDAASSDVRNLALVMEDYASDNSGAYSNDLAAMGFTPSEGVVIGVNLYDSTHATPGYCIESRHVAFGGSTTAMGTENWVYNATGNASVVQVQHEDPAAANCPATPTTTAAFVEGT